MKMKDMVIGMRLEDTRTNELFTVVEKNSKFKTVLLEAADGTTRSSSIATIAKHFVEVLELDKVEETVEAVETVEVETVEVETVETVEPAEEEKKERKEKKTRKERKKREKIDIWAIIDPLLEENNCIVKIFQKGRSVYVGKKKVLELWERNTSVRVYLKSELFNLIDIDINDIEKVAEKPGDKNYMSFYIPAGNIETVLTTILSA